MDSFDADFHVHSRYSGGTSDRMELPVIVGQAGLKGLDLVASGDALHPKWLKHLKKTLSEVGDGVYGVEGSDVRFIVQTEVEDCKRVHHIILFPSISAAESLRDSLKGFSRNIDLDGRAHIRIGGEELVDYAREVDALVGPAHVFTPWTSLYKEHDSLSECYGSNLRHIKFVELGLSADSSMADGVAELQDLSFLSNSDTHSPWPHRLGREFNRIRVKELSFPEIVKALEYGGGRGFVLNAGLDPREGKYHLTACSRCFLKFKSVDAVGLRYRCPECGGRIKKGVLDRVAELSSWDEPKRPAHRPSYLRIVPLAEVISLATGISTLTSKKIRARWDSLVEGFGSEINVLVDADVGDLKKADLKVGSIIERFRSGRMNYVAGGGGLYGKPTLGEGVDEFWGYGQKTLTDY
ncbi:MAG: TIGR00375 family protein [Candidatus Altiarchaeota archaeon]|nr:TIGR00375 family protein [Candidatus Altiarchaeota archaeon]